MGDCRKAVELLHEYLDGNVSEKLRAALSKHFEDCPPCLDFLETYKKTSTLCREALAKKAPRELSDRLTQFLRERCNQSKMK